jgi:hypothetical protein
MGDEPVEHDPRDGEAARPEDSTAWQDATLRRPALDPAIPRVARDLLRARGDLLAPAPPHNLGRSRSLLPASGERREAMVSNAVTGLTAALFVAVVGATPWAVGVLVFQQPVGWQSAAGRYGLLLAELIIAVTAIAFGARVARFGEPQVEDEAVTAARIYRGRYLTDADFDARARVLLRRAQDAINAVTSAAIVREDLLDEPATSALLAEQEWQIALALREQARLRALRSGLAEPRPGSPGARLLDDHRRTAQAAEQSTAKRVAALERYAAEVHGADAAYRDWREHAAIAELSGPHLDLLARTAADDHGITELDALTEHARDLRQSFTEHQD